MRYFWLVLFALAVAIMVGASLWCGSCRLWLSNNNNVAPTPVITGSGEWQDKIKISSLKPGQAISSPLTIKGEARGVWFFEASFPVYLVDWDGRIIAEGVAIAEDDPATGEINWMTEEYVPFSVTLNFAKPSYGERGAIIFRKDNPSGLSQYDAALELPITFR